MSDHPAGTVAVATVRGIEGVRVMRTTGNGGADFIWLTSEVVGGARYHPADRVTDIRPLVVLDLERSARSLPLTLRRLADREQAEDSHPGRLLGVTADLRELADQIKAQTKPARIPEPTTPLAEVIASTANWPNGRRRLVLGYEDHWVDGAACYSWDDLIDPEPVTS